MPKSQSSGKQLLWDFGKGLLLMALLALITVGVEHTSFGKRVELFGYDWLQRHLASEHVPVVVVDISDLKPTPFRVDGQTGIATSRETLQTLIEAITAQDPRAIGVDIDFSPDSFGYVWPRDPKFFEFCLKNRVPVFLGISRSVSLLPNQWLGTEDYESLATSIIIPNGDTRKMAKWIRVSRDSTPGRTLSAAVAGGFQETQSGLSRWLHDHKLVEQVSERDLGQDIAIGEFPVDYSPLRTLMEDKTLQTINPDVIRDQGHLLRGKIVLVGRGITDDKVDHFRVAGFEEEIPGVYIHACAAYTLHDAPLYELTRASRLGIDLLLSFVVLLSVIAIRFYYLNRTTRRVATHRLQIILTMLVIIGAFIAGVTFVGQTRLMWSDFVLVLGVLVLHIPIERLLEKGHKTKKREQGQLIRDLILEKERAETK